MRVGSRRRRQSDTRFEFVEQRLLTSLQIVLQSRLFAAVKPFASQTGWTGSLLFNNWQSIGVGAKAWAFGAGGVMRASAG